MITAVDTSVLIDIFRADRNFGPASREALRTCRVEGSLIACDPVWAEVTSNFPASEAAREAMNRFEISYTAFTVDAAVAAGEAWRDYRRRGGPRTRVITDFLVGAHAFEQADRLLTRDRGFYRSYFKPLSVVDPGKE